MIRRVGIGDTHGESWLILGIDIKKQLVATNHQLNSARLNPLDGLNSSITERHTPLNALDKPWPPLTPGGNRQTVRDQQTLGMAVA